MGPFFQGGIQDLMNVAGPSNGGFLLGQMMHEQRKAQEQELQKSILGNLQTKQNMQFAADKHPLDQDILRKRIEEYDANIAGKKEETRGKKFANEVDAQVGVPTVAKGRTADIEQKSLNVDAERMKQWADMFMTTEWSPSLFRNLPELFTRLQLPNELATQAATAAQSKESWDNFRNNYYNSTPGARKEDQLQAGRLAVQEERTAAAVEAARLRSEAAAAKTEQVRNLQHAATQLNMQAWKKREEAKAAQGARQQQLLQEATELEARAAAYITQARELNPAIANPPFEFPGMPPRREVPAVPPVAPPGGGAGTVGAPMSENQVTPRVQQGKTSTGINYRVIQN